MPPEVAAANILMDAAERPVIQPSPTLRAPCYTVAMMRPLLAAAVVCALTAGTARAEGAMAGAAKPLDTVPFAADQDVACLQSALETGNPETGPSTWILKAPPGCLVPWHSHTAEEQLMVVAGRTRCSRWSPRPFDWPPVTALDMPKVGRICNLAAKT